QVRLPKSGPACLLDEHRPRPADPRESLRQRFIQLGQYMKSLGPMPHVSLIKTSLDEQHIANIGQITRPRGDELQQYQVFRADKPDGHVAHLFPLATSEQLLLKR